MGNQVPFNTVYFCGNCEEEVAGMPAGSRIPSGRPLCQRCTEIGQEEGWAAIQQSATDTRIYPPSSKQGIILLLFMMASTALLIFLLKVLGADERH